MKIEVIFLINNEYNSSISKKLYQTKKQFLKKMGLNNQISKSKITCSGSCGIEKTKDKFYKLKTGKYFPICVSCCYIIQFAQCKGCLRVKDKEIFSNNMDCIPCHKLLLKVGEKRCEVCFNGKKYKLFYLLLNGEHSLTCIECLNKSNVKQCETCKIPLNYIMFYEVDNKLYFECMSCVNEKGNKQCKKCLNLKKFDLFNKNSNGYYLNTCRDCENFHNRERKIKNKEIKIELENENMEIYLCNTCNNNFRENEFYKIDDALYFECIKCCTDKAMQQCNKCFSIKSFDLFESRTYPSGKKTLRKCCRICQYASRKENQQKQKELISVQPRIIKENEQKCIECNEIFLNDKFYIIDNKITPECKKCYEKKYTQKPCNKCLQQKHLNQFYIRNDTITNHSTGTVNIIEGYRNECKECSCQNKKDQYNHPHIKELINTRNKEYYQLNSKEILIKKKEYHQKNKEQIRIRQKLFYQKNKPRLLLKLKEYRIKNKDKIKEYRNQYYKKNINKIKEYQKQYRLKNKNSKNNKKRNKTFKINPKLILYNRITRRTRTFLEYPISYENLINCSQQFLVEWFEFNFKLDTTWNMSFDNPDSFHIDHVYPLSKVNLFSKEKRLVFYSWMNLRPTNPIYNIQKSNKIEIKDIRLILNRVEEFLKIKMYIQKINTEVKDNIIKQNYLL